MGRSSGKGEEMTKAQIDEIKRLTQEIMALERGAASARADLDKALGACNHKIPGGEVAALSRLTFEECEICGAVL